MAGVAVTKQNKAKPIWGRKGDALSAGWGKGKGKGVAPTRRKEWRRRCGIWVEKIQVIKMRIVGAFALWELGFGSLPLFLLPLLFGINKSQSKLFVEKFADQQDRTEQMSSSWNWRP
ncbi:hypothetical protein V6N11_022412 [Hibiscus sabdariffa]|uniref:Uncharacterized protein n=1 Tax=Hibiscus sabdariffa TaxID=183260 RepID=A0ABR2TJ26_9ROSI